MLALLRAKIFAAGFHGLVSTAEKIWSGTLLFLVVLHKEHPHSNI